MVYLVSLILAPLWAFPLLSANFARHQGRSYKLWLFLGIALPVISVIILTFLPDVSEKREHEKNA
jgi:hypothetical protein